MSMIAVHVNSVSGQSGWVKAPPFLLSPKEGVSRVTTTVASAVRDAPSRVVRLRISSAAIVEVAVQMAANGFPVALLLPDQRCNGDHLPARPLGPVERQRAAALLAEAGRLKQEEFLDQAAEIFGVAAWPRSITGFYGKG